MALPPNAITFKQPMAPKDVLEWLVPLSKGTTTADRAPFLADGEDVASFTMTTTAEAAALGVQIKTGGSYGPSVANNQVLFWTSVALAQQGLAAFEGEGVKIGLELTVTTNNTPPRIKSRIIVIQVARL